MGERARNIGEDAEDISISFIRELGYIIDEPHNEEFNIDCISHFNDAKQGLKKPLFSPEGKVAFEFTNENFSKRKVAGFKDKIERYNLINPQNIMHGGIIFSSGNASEKLLEYGKNNNVYCWDFHRRALYRRKKDIYKNWFKTGYPNEIIIDNETSYLSYFNYKKLRKEPSFIFSIFFSSKKRMSSSLINSALQKLKTISVMPLLELNYVPVQMSVDFHALGGFSIEKYDLIEMVKDWKNERIIINFPENLFVNYNTFPELA